MPITFSTCLCASCYGGWGVRCRGHTWTWEPRLGCGWTKGGSSGTWMIPSLSTTTASQAYCLQNILRMWMLPHFPSLYSLQKRWISFIFPLSVLGGSTWKHFISFLNVILSTCSRIRGAGFLQENLRRKVPITRQSSLPCPGVGVTVDGGGLVERTSSPEHIQEA